MTLLNKMAITLVNRPSLISPAFNQMQFKATSTETAQPNFRYYIQINVAGNVLSPLVLPARPSGDVIFDLQPLLKDFIQSYFPFGVAGWTVATNQIITVTVNIGEKYGTTPTVYAGTTETYTPYYASLTNKEMLNYTSINYSWPLPLSNYSSQIRINDNDNLVFHWLQQIAGDIDGVRVRTYINGLIQSDSYIANGLTINNVPNKLVCINLGLTALSALTAPQVTGDFPIITSGITGMIIDFYDAVTTIRYNVEVSTCCGSGEEEETTLYYVNSKGAFEHVNFCTRVKKDLQAIQTTYRPIEQYFKTSYRNSGGSMVNISTPLDQSLKVIGNTYEVNNTYTSAPLTESECTQLSECFNSPKLLLQTGTHYEYISSKDTTFVFKKKVIEKVIQFVMNCKNNLIEKRQTNG